MKMAIDSWLPINFKLPDGSRFRNVCWDGQGWQIVKTEAGVCALIAESSLAKKWTNAGLVEEAAFQRFDFGERHIYFVSGGRDQMLCPIFDSRSPNHKEEALAFAQALRATRSIDPHSALQDGLYVERLTRLLPGHTISTRTADDVVLGYWLTGGLPISVSSTRRLSQVLSWMTSAQLNEVLATAGLESATSLGGGASATTFGDRTHIVTDSGGSTATFQLPGRPELESFLNEHVVDIIRNQVRYKAFGIAFPSAIVLHGPPGCGKTFAVDRLIDFLGWPSFRVEASSIASPYIHETSRKVSEVFDQATKSAPAVVIIDEMDAFLAERDTASGQHRVEEIAEFLRRIPEAAKNEVLVIAMTNRLDIIDPAILRRGRFDHVVSVGPATASEIQALLTKLLSDTPAALNIDTAVLAAGLAGRPLSDVAFVVREGARLAVRDGKEQLDHASIQVAMKTVVNRTLEDGPARRIGFI